MPQNKKTDLYAYALTAEVSKAIKDHYRNRCQYCDAEGANHIDHIIPQAAGGEDNLGNYILACARCNQKKGAGEIAPQYLALITAIADRNKDWIRNKIRGRYRGRGAYTLHIGLSPQLCHRMTVSDPPTLFELRCMEFFNNFWMDVRRRLNAAESA